MGEYARYNGQEVKIGTCEDMLYLRRDQRDLITHSQTDVHDPAVLDVIRFRFPFPDEDGKRPGDFDDPFRTIGLYGVEVPEGVEHRQTQFVSQRGYNVMLPCPEVAGELKFHRNGNPGPVRFGQQALRNGLWVLIGECGGCGAIYRYETFEMVEPVIVALRSLADRSQREHDLYRQSHPEFTGSAVEGRATFYNTIADRITEGYTVAVSV